MDTQFEFTEKNGGACVTRILSPGAACVVPESLGGYPVTELSDRAFARTGVREIFLPKGLKRIGRYCFYGCEGLESLHVFAGTTEIGGGVFNGCANVKEIFFHLDATERSALRDFVTELNGRLTVHFFLSSDGEDKEAFRLIFPAYYDEAVENTPARITVSNIHGTGQKYRYCFEDKKVRFDKYDRLFIYEKAEEPVSMAAEIAVSRLMYPHGLWEEARVRYREFIEENLYPIMLQNLQKPECFLWLLREFTGKQGLTEEETDRLIGEASKRRLAEIAGLLMDYKHRSFSEKKKKFAF